jgi:hypothetical protein
MLLLIGFEIGINFIVTNYIGAGKFPILTPNWDFECSTFFLCPKSNLGILQNRNFDTNLAKKIVRYG